MTDSPEDPPPSDEPPKKPRKKSRFKRQIGVHTVYRRKTIRKIVYKEPKKPVGRAPHKPSEATKTMVIMMTADGKMQLDVSRILGISTRTLRKHYRNELDNGAAKANVMVTSTLYQAATGGGNWRDANMTAAIWWDKTRNGKVEPKQSVELSGAVGTYDLSKLTDEQLTALQSILAHAGASSGGNSEERRGEE